MKARLVCAWALMVLGAHIAFASFCLGAWGHYFMWANDVTGWVATGFGYGALLVGFGFWIRDKAINP